MANGTIQGLDVSHYQGTVNWPQVCQAGIQFAFAKATDGLTWTDPQFAVNWPQMKAAGILRGAYHFFEPADDAAAQAQFFLQTAQLAPGDLPPALDVETLGGRSATAMWQGVETWLQTVAAATGVQPFLYVDPSFANQYQAPVSLAAYPLWIADYGVAQPTLPAGWSSWLIWQYNESGVVSGISGPVDLDQLAAPLATLAALALPPPASP
jgi:lysozyme